MRLWPPSTQPRPHGFLGRLVALFADTLEAESDRWILWLPVFFAAGIALYFALATEPETRVAAAGYSASGVAENVYGSFPPLTGQGVISWWATDQTDIRHNQNLLTTKYTEIGVAYAFFNNFGYYVIVFATP